VLLLIIGLQLFTIVASRGNMYLLGEAYAFGVVWSFVFKAAAMVVLRFKDRSPREFKVPLNVRVRGVELPVGVGLVFLVLAAAALLNLLTKEVATIAGSAFTAVFLSVFIISERYHEKRRGSAAHRHVEQFNQQTVDEVSAGALRLTRPFRKLVAIRSPQNLFMLEKALSETDPDNTDVVVMTARVIRRGDTAATRFDLDQYDRELMTAVVTRAEKAGKPVQPLILATNNPLYAVINTARDIGAQEVVLGTSNVYTADEQVDQIAFYWIDLHGGQPRPLTVRLLSQSRDISFDLAGGNRIPKIGERKARSVAELRSAGVGVRHVLLVHDGTREGSDLFLAALTMLDPQIALTIVPVGANPFALPDPSRVDRDVERAAQLKREVELRRVPADQPATHLIDLARQLRCDLIVLSWTDKPPRGEPVLLDVDLILRSAPCRVCLVASPRVPDEVAG
jgi:nucleotide-binding universal stress UspA family protein